MKSISHLILLSLVLCISLCCCGKNGEPENGGTDKPQVPTAISADPAIITAETDGSTHSVKLVAPARPKVVGVPSWITFRDGTYDSKKYSMTVTLTVAANATYEERKCTLLVSAAGVADGTIIISQPGKQKIDDPTLEDNPAIRRALEMGLGWNLGNQLDAYINWTGSDRYLQPDETVWGNQKATQATFTKVASYGFKTVRIPVTWLATIGEAPDYKIDATWMARVTEVVGYAHNAGLNVIVNTHHDENHGDDHWLNLKDAPGNATLNTLIKQEITAVWTQIANQFKDCGDWLMFEGFNELNDGGWGWSADFRADPTRQCNVLNEWQQTFVDAVRATGGNNATRWLGISTYAANPEYEKYMTLPTDEAGKLMVSVHFYDPSDYTIGDAQYSDWGHTGEAGKKATWGDEDHVKQVFNNLYTKYVSKGTPVYIGEFGCSLRSKSDTRAWAFYLYYLEYVTKAARTYGMPAIVWDNGGDDSAGKEHHGYINHATGNYMSNGREPVQAMVKGWTTTSTAYTLDAVYNSAPKL